MLVVRRMRRVYRVHFQRPFIPYLAVIAIWLWSAHALLGKVSSVSDTEQIWDKVGLDRRQRLKIQGLELKVDAVISDFKSASRHCTALGSELLTVAAELKGQIASIHSIYSAIEANPEMHCPDSSGSGSRSKGWLGWILQIVGPILQAVGGISIAYHAMKIFGEFQNKYLPKLESKWNDFQRKVTFDPTFDYMVDVYRYRAEE